MNSHPIMDGAISLYSPRGQTDERVRVLLCCDDEEAGARVRTLLDGCRGLEVVGQINGTAGANAAAAEFRPDVVILAPNKEVEATPVAPFQRPIPTLLIVDGDVASGTPSDRARARSSRVSRLSRSVLERDEKISRSHLQTRLQLLAARTARQQRTVTARSLQKQISAFRAERNRMRSVVENLAKSPREMIVLWGGRGSERMLKSIISAVGSVRVPVVIAVDEPSDASVGVAAARLKLLTSADVAPLCESTLLKSLDGFHLLGPCPAVVDDDMIRISSRLDEEVDRVGSFVASLRDRSARVLSIFLSGPGHPDDGESPVCDAVMDPEIVPVPNGGRKLVRERGCVTLSADEIAWLLAHSLQARR